MSLAEDGIGIAELHLRLVLIVALATSVSKGRAA